MTFTKYSTICAITLLGACGGNGSSTTRADTPVLDPLTLPEARLSYDELRERASLAFDGELRVIATTSDLPTSGTADYSGYIDIRAENPNINGTPSTQNMIGEIVLRADFNDSTLSGTAGNFRENGDSAVNGTISLTDGTIDTSGQADDQVTYSANFDGTLTGSNNNSLAIDGRIDGDFRNPSGNALGLTTAVVSGTSTLNNETQTLNGAIIAERQ